MKWFALLFSFLYPSTSPASNGRPPQPVPLHPTLPLSRLWKPHIPSLSGQRHSQNRRPAPGQAPFIPHAAPFSQIRPKGVARTRHFDVVDPILINGSVSFPQCV